MSLNFATLVGSYGAVAEMLDEAGAVPGTSGIMLIFDDFIEGMESFGMRIQPLMKSRSMGAGLKHGPPPYRNRHEADTPPQGGRIASTWAQNETRPAKAASEPPPTTM